MKKNLDLQPISGYIPKTIG